MPIETCHPQTAYLLSRNGDDLLRSAFSPEDLRPLLDRDLLRTGDSGRNALDSDRFLAAEPQEARGRRFRESRGEDDRRAGLLAGIVHGRIVDRRDHQAAEQSVDLMGERIGRLVVEEPEPEGLLRGPLDDALVLDHFDRRLELGRHEFRAQITAEAVIDGRFASGHARHGHRHSRRECQLFHFSLFLFLFLFFLVNRRAVSSTLRKSF